MEDQKKIIKDDINFLEYPNWTISKKKKKTVYSMQKNHGKYEVLSPLGLPKHFDKIVVYFLLYKLYKENGFTHCSIDTSRYEIAKNIFGGNHFGKNVYVRIMNSIMKWLSITIRFEGVFYDGDGYTSRGFGVINEYTLRRETGELTIQFNESYITQLRETKFYKLIDFEQYKKLHKACSARLYEILIKSFKDREDWAINLQLLAEKLTLEKRKSSQNYYPSDVLRYLKPAINEINKKTELSIKFTYNKENETCIFDKVAKKKEEFIPAIRAPESKKKKISTEAKIKSYLDKFKALVEEEQHYILQAIKRDQFLQFLEPDVQIYSYMVRMEQQGI